MHFGAQAAAKIAIALTKGYKRNLRGLISILNRAGRGFGDPHHRIRYQLISIIFDSHAPVTAGRRSNARRRDSFPVHRIDGADWRPGAAVGGDDPGANTRPGGCRQQGGKRS